MFAQNGGYYPQFQNPYLQTGAVPDALSQMKVPYQKPANDIIWVQGEAGAKAYLIAPNNTVVLWDTESPTIYINSADNTGIPSMRVLDFTERSAQAETHTCKCGDKFVTKEQFDELKSKFEEYIAMHKEEEDNA